MGLVCYTLLNISVAQIHLSIWMATSVLLAVMMVVVNAFLIVALHKTKQMNSSTSKLVAAMSLSDITVGTLAFPLIVILFSKQAELQNCHLHYSTQYVTVSTGYTSFLLLILVAFDRYLHLTKLNAYNKFMSKRKLIVFALGAVVAAHLIAVLITTSNGSFPLQIALNTGNLIGLIAVNIMYAAVVRKIKRNKRVVGARMTFMPSAIAQSSTWNTVVPQGSMPVSVIHCGNVRKGGQLKPSKHSKRFGVTENTLKMQPSQGLSTPGFHSLARKTKRQDVAAIGTIKLTLITMLCLYIPYNITTTAIAYYRYQLDTEPAYAWKVLSVWSYLLLLTNGIMNAAIFVNGNRTLRSYARRLLSESSIYPERLQANLE